MISTSIGNFWIDLLCKPAFKAIAKCPEVALLLLIVVYGCIAYRCLRSAYEITD